MKYAILLVALFLVACGGGDIEAHRITVAFYGDSITAGRPMDIAQGKFDVQDFAAPAKLSNAPLDVRDVSSITVLRYGMADAVLSIPPEMTRLNLLLRIMQIMAGGRRAVVVNVNQTESGLEKPTNAAIADLVNIDVSGVPGATVDGIHPNEDFHVVLNARIHDGLMAIIARR